MLFVKCPKVENRISHDRIWQLPLARKEKRSDGKDEAQGKAGNTVDVVQDCVACMFHCHYSGWGNGRVRLYKWDCVNVNGMASGNWKTLVMHERSRCRKLYAIVFISLSRTHIRTQTSFSEQRHFPPLFPYFIEKKCKISKYLRPQNNPSNPNSSHLY